MASRRQVGCENNRRAWDAAERNRRNERWARKNRWDLDNAAVATVDDTCQPDEKHDGCRSSQKTLNRDDE